MGPGSHEQCQEEEEEETHRFLSTTMLLREMSFMICQRPCTHTDGHTGYGSQPASHSPLPAFPCVEGRSPMPSAKQARSRASPLLSVCLCVAGCPVVTFLSTFSPSALTNATRVLRFGISLAATCQHAPPHHSPWQAASQASTGSSRGSDPLLLLRVTRDAKGERGCGAEHLISAAAPAPAAWPSSLITLTHPPPAPALPHPESAVGGTVEVVLVGHVAALEGRAPQEGRLHCPPQGRHLALHLRPRHARHAADLRRRRRAPEGRVGEGT